MPKKHTLLIAVLSLFMALLACNLTAGAAPDENSDEATGDAEDMADTTPTPDVTATPTQLLIAPTFTPEGATGGDEDFAPPTLTPPPDAEGDDNGDSGEGDDTEGEEEPTEEAPDEEADEDGETEGDEPRPTVTPLPEPTPIEAEEETGPGVTGPGINIDPQLGDPGTDITVRGSGFEPGQEITLHWGPPGGSTGTQFDTLEADEDGEFETFVTVPAAASWPGGTAQEGDEVELRAVYDEFGSFYFARFKFVPIFNPAEPVLNFDNPDEGYSVSVPNGWTWQWTEDNTDNVRFSSPSGAGGGFIRVVNSSDVPAVIEAVMAEEAPGVGYTTGEISAGQYPGTQVTDDNGRLYFFIPSGGQTYVISFVDDSGSPPLAVLNTFRLLE